MANDRGRALPKFGEWDVNNPASADGFTVIFAKARDEKKATGTVANGKPAQTSPEQVARPAQAYGYQQYSPPASSTKRRFCCF